MKTIAVSAVTAGGKTTAVNGLKIALKNSCSLHFDDYSFEGEVDDFHQWVLDGADYNVWNLKPLENDIIRIKNSNKYEYLILDYPFAYRNDLIKKYIDVAVFIDTPLDIALARHIIRDMENASAKEICDELTRYLQYARLGYEQMIKDIVPSSDYIIDGSLDTVQIVNKIIEIL